MNPFKNPVAFLRNVAFIEGVSYLILLFIAMPLKYIWGQPQAVRIVGMAHGVLFVIFCASLLHTKIVARWPLSRSTLVFLASLIPFGPWIIDRRMRHYETDFSSSNGRSPRASELARPTTAQSAEH
jgi:integral membrane protein